MVRRLDSKSAREPVRARGQAKISKGGEGGQGEVPLAWRSCAYYSWCAPRLGNDSDGNRLGQLVRPSPSKKTVMVMLGKETPCGI